MEIRYFGIAHEITNKNSESIVIKLPLTVTQLRKILSEAYPELNKLRSYAIACDEHYVEDSYIIDSDKTRVAVLPPVSGG
ncbi:MAG: MoaD/ThiS family protein [Chitinophagales bacterium]|nr:MoaD/ThiS family protein [Chitinophagales bacterium]